MPANGDPHCFINTGSPAAPVRWRLSDLSPCSKPTHRPALLALHGFTGCAADFRWLANACADTFHCYGLDFLGHGGSDAPASPLPYAPGPTVRAIGKALHIINTTALAAATAATETAAAQPQPETAVAQQQLATTQQQPKATTAQQQPATRHLPILLGYSMGGRMALRYLARHGCGGIRALVLIGASAGLPDPTERRQRRHADHALAHRIDTEGLQAFIAHWNQLPLIASQQRSPYFAALQQSRSTNHPHGLANSLRGIGTGALAPVDSRLATLDVPCLLVTGEQDAKFSAIATRLAQKLPQARHLSIPHAGHSPHWEAPAAFTAALLQWLRQLP